jgi:16S rRNA processing protein RimM
MRGDPRIEIGRIARAHGIRGEVVIVTHDPESDVIDGLPAIWIGGVERRVVEARGTPHRGWLVRFEGIATRNDAETLRGQPVEVDRDALGLEDDDVLLADLVGCQVRRVDGSPWGTIHEVQSGGMQDLLVIHDGELERLLPLVDEFVTEIDVEAGVVTVDPPDGLPEHKLLKK